MVRYRFFLCYDGSLYAGWQRQTHGLGIQEVVEKALSIYLRTPIKITGASRTDQGVHALSQVVHFDIPDPIPDISKFSYHINALLPKEIRLFGLELAPLSFHARFDAKGKHYIYQVSTAAVQSPFEKLNHHHCYRELDIEQIKKASSLFIGEHDFYSFTSHPDHFPSHFNFRRTLFSIELQKESERLIFHFKGNAFLHKMIRNITGTLLDIGLGKLPVDIVEKLLRERRRKEAGLCAPAHGLTLAKVFYDPIS